VIRSVAKKVGDPVRQGETLAAVESNESLQTYPVVAPLAGVVTARNANPGEQTGDKALFTVADLSTVWVELSLFPRDVGKVRVGQAVRVRSADAGLSADGKVVYVAPFGSTTSQTLTARVLLDNSTRRWAPGLYVTAEVTLSEVAVPLAVRNDALQTLEARAVVFVQGDKGFSPRALRLGRSDGEHTEVVDGLAAGEIYVTRNSFILKAELGKGEAEHEH
jgi:cobalt-zinc-cadmium efflux system membrane fusion protein